MGKFVSYIFAIFAKRARCSFRPINGIEQTQAGQSGGKGCTTTSTMMYALHFLEQFLLFVILLKSVVTGQSGVKKHHISNLGKRSQKNIRILSCTICAFISS